MSQVATDLPPLISSDEAQFLLSIELYEDKHISLGKSANIAGDSKRVFVVFLFLINQQTDLDFPAH